MFMASQAALSSTVQLMTSGNLAAIALAEFARYVGLHTLGGASTSQRAYRLPLASDTPRAMEVAAAAAAQRRVTHGVNACEAARPLCV